MMKQIFLKRGSFYLLIVFLKRDTLEKTYVGTKKWSDWSKFICCQIKIGSSDYV